MPSIIVCWYGLLCLAPSGPPLGISAIALGPRVIQINWNQPLPMEQNGFIRSYKLNITEAETGQHIQLTTNNTTITAGGLHPYFNYHISVAAVTVAVGPYTEIYSLQTPQDGKQIFLCHPYLQVHRCIDIWHCMVVMRLHNVILNMH